MTTNSEGKGTLGCIFSLVLLGAAVFVGVQVGPPYFAYKSLEADVSTEVSRAGAHFFNDTQIVQNVLDVARKNEILLKAEDIKVERLAGQVYVSIHYQVPVDLGFLEHTFDFRIKVSSFVGAL
jgi:hypothetical protein